MTPRQQQAHLIIYSSPNGQNSWSLVKPEDVPEWVKSPPVISRLIRGEVAQHSHNGLALPAHLGLNLWYRAERVLPDSEVKAVIAAREKREKRLARNKERVH